jgi:potassium-transporting ATPase potassium-binding subunit
MTLIGWTQILLFCLIIVAPTPPLGGYMARVFSGERTFLSPIRQVEIAIYKIAGVNEQSEQHAVTYTVDMLLFHVDGFVFLCALMRFQALLPFNPADQSAVPPAKDRGRSRAAAIHSDRNRRRVSAACSRLICERPFPD